MSETTGDQHPALVTVIGCILGMFMTFALGAVIGQAIAVDTGEAGMCRQWGKKEAVVYEGRCMVPTKDGGLRPARKDTGHVP